MRLTQVLNTAPRFRYWKDFGAGRRRRMPFFKQWYNTYRYIVARKPVEDYTIPVDKLPPNSRVVEAELFMNGHIDALPDELIRRKEEKILYDHPWPFNVQLDETKNQTPMYTYSIDVRFFVPRQDALVLTNSLLESDSLEANPPFEPNEEQLEIIQRQYDWSTRGDSVLTKQPLNRKYPRINIRPTVVYGIAKERKEFNVMGSFQDFAQNLVAQFHHKNQDREKLSELLDRRSISFPHCHVPLLRDNRKINLQLCIDHLSISARPLPLIDKEAEKTTKEKKIVDIRPRGWKSILEQTRNYKPSWSFTLPRDSYLNTIQLCSRIIREHRDQDEMFARALLHSFGLTTQFSRLKHYERQLTTNSEKSRLASVILDNPLEIESITKQHDSREILEQPIVLQTIAYDLSMDSFHFMRFQLNSTNFNGNIKNQVWYSGPVSSMRQVLRYYLDFQSFNSFGSVNSFENPRVISGQGDSNPSEDVKKFVT